MRHLGTGLKLAGLICASVALARLSELTFGGEALPGQQASQAQITEVDLALCWKIPAGLVAGTRDYPRLVEIPWIRIEPKERPRGVTVHVEWSAAAEATWRVSVDLLDDQGRLLYESRDEGVVFTGKAGGLADAGMHHADLDLGYKSFQVRRFAAKARIRLERVSDQTASVAPGESVGQPLQIKVIDGKSRKPLADVAVVAQAYYTDKKLRSEVLLYSTDAEGLCRITGLKPASISLTIQKDGYGTIQCSKSTQPSVQPAPEFNVIEMRPAQPIGGIVQDEDGKPIVDVEVGINVNSNEVGGMGYMNQIVRTDENGRWRVNGVQSEPDTVALELKHPEYVSSYAWDETIITRQLADAQAFKHVEHLTKGVNINGRVLEANGQPVPRAAVTLAPPRRGGFQYGYACVRTDASGCFHFGCAKDMRGDTNTGGGPTAVYVEAAGHAPMMKKLFIEPNVPPLEFWLSAGRTVTVRVVSPDGQPISGASAQLYPLPEDPGQSVFLKMNTDEQGRFQAANVPDNEMRVTVDKRGYLTIKDHVLPASGGEYTLTMTSGARVQGTVCDAQTGQPIPHFNAVLRDATGFDEVQFFDLHEFSDGKYEFSPRERVSIDLWLIVSASGYKGVKSEAFRLEGGTRQMDFKLEKNPSSGKPTARPVPSIRVVRGTVQDPNGRPATKASIDTAPLVGVQVTTDAEGKFKVLMVPGMMAPPGAREEAVFLIARDREHNLAAAVKLDSTITGDIVVNLSPGTILAGRVVDPEGKGVPGVGLLPLFYSSPGSAQGLPGATKSDPNGYFEIRALPGGHRYTVRATAEGYGETYVEVNTTKTVSNRLQLKPLVLLPANLKVGGVVVTSEGKPVPGVNVYGSAGGQPTRTTRTDAQGRFTLENICAGPIRITVHADLRSKEILHESTQAKGGDTDVRIVVPDSSLQSGPKGNIVP